MSAKRLLQLGATLGILAVIASWVDGGMFALLAFCGGALFGKGYGILEARGVI